eukprot:1183088-Prorocentrum_minimum.AAC.2
MSSPSSIPRLHMGWFQPGHVDVIGIRVDVIGIRVDVIGIRVDVIGIRVDVIVIGVDVIVIGVDVSRLFPYHGLEAEAHLLDGDGPAVVLVESLEERPKPLDFVAAHVLRNHVQRHLFQLVHAAELLEAVQHGVIQLRVGGLPAHLQPRVLKRFRRRYPLLGVLHLHIPNFKFQIRRA